MDTISCIVKDKVELYRMYMPFIVGGGLFIPTATAYKLGERVQIDLILLNESFNFEGKVIWRTPQGASIRQQPGIGIQIPSSEAALLSKLRLYLDDPELSKMTIERYTFC